MPTHCSAASAIRVAEDGITLAGEALVQLDHRLADPRPDDTEIGQCGQHLYFVPQILDRSVIDEVVAVSEDDSLANARRLAREEGIPAGISSGAALTAALKLAAAPQHAGKMIVVLLADSGERYLTTPLVGELVR